MATASVRKEDRLFSLILALSATRDGLTKGDIFRSVHGYVERFNHEADQTLDKLFERDKRDLREMGVVITTFELAGEEGLTHHVRYAITPEGYKLPDDVTFTSEEMSYLQLAAAVWRELALSVDARHALTKLRSLGIQAANDLAHIAPRLGSVERSFSAITEALENELILEISYAKPGESALRLRHVAPLGMAQWHDRWYMLAHDIDSDSERTFLLSRIRGALRHLPQQTFPRTNFDYSARLIQELEAIAAEHAVTLRLDSDSELSYTLARWGATPGGNHTWKVPTADIELLADELLPFASEVTVLEPVALRDALVRRLTTMLHYGETYE